MAIVRSHRADRPTASWRSSTIRVPSGEKSSARGGGSPALKVATASRPAFRTRRIDRAPVAYIYGEVQRPGPLRVERGLTLLQALAGAGGLSPRGTERGIRVHRRDANGAVRVYEMKMNDLVERDDVIYVKKSLF